MDNLFEYVNFGLSYVDVKLDNGIRILGSIIQATQQSNDITFQEPFITNPLVVANPVSSFPTTIALAHHSTNGFRVLLGNGSSLGVRWLAIGRWK